jgi:hypothetical protein
MQIFENLPPIVGLILGFVLLVWIVFVFLVPFMIEGIRRSARETHNEIVELNRKLDELTRYLADLARAADSGRAANAAGALGSARGMDSDDEADSGRGMDSAGSARAGAGAELRGSMPAKPPSKQAAKGAAGRSETRRRREPTISETDFQNEPRPPRREPRVK